MIERPHIYVHHIGSLAPAQYAQDIPLVLDTDAPFALRGRSIRVALAPTIARTDVTSLSFRRRNPQHDYTSTDLIPVAVDMPFGCGGGCVRPVYPEELFAPGQPIHTDVKNNSATLTLDVTVYYHGVKLFPGVAPQYPARASLLPYTYSLPRLTPTTPTGLILQAGGAGATLRDVVFTVSSDAAFALRSAQCAFLDATASVTYQQWNNMSVIVYDWQKKAYMSAGGVPTAVDIDHAFGRMGAIALAGPWNPGLFVPEILLQPYGNLFFDFTRDDSAFPAALPTLFQVVLGGMKVFQK